MTRAPVILYTLLAFALLLAAGRVNLRLLDQRVHHRIVQATDPLENAPPLVAFTTVALGGFRGILADLLWIRAGRLQAEGKYFELVQLADWITKLEPRFTEVWAYQAWNLAYNISVMFATPEDRWRWVRHGVTLLRDHGLRYNPGEPRLLFELGWLFQHKIGGTFDDAHMHYKSRWSREIQTLFGGPRPNLDLWLTLPPTRPELLEETGVRDLVASLEREGISPWSLRLLDLPPDHPAQTLLNRSPASTRLLEFVRRHHTLETYHLRPDLIRAIHQRHGLLDWRLPQAHAIYWATLSRDLARQPFDRIAADRMIHQSLQDTFRRGNAILDPNQNLLTLAPNLAVLPYVLDAYQSSIHDHPDLDAFRSAYVNFLIDAAYIFYTYNRQRDAQRMFDLLAQFRPDLTTGLTMEQFVYQSFAGQLDSLDDYEALAAVEGALVQSLFWETAGDPERAAGFDRLARNLWTRYMTPRLHQQALRERTGLPPLEDIRAMAARRLGLQP
ncbi:MAG TPA: hypothetical protein PKE55_08740 [Kiritimatiellia bacterium]|nr:hypothetical protein [Kiritimatiellia bacterium]